jgi:hypothetical protein
MDLQDRVEHSEAVENQVQGFINAGLLTMDQGGVPQINTEAVLASDRESVMTEQVEPEQIQSITNRRQAQVFGQNMLEMVDDQESEQQFQE